MRAGSLVRADVAAILAAQTESGAILACPAYPTYRYSWLRDGAFCAAALDAAGSVGPAARYHAWAAARVLAHAAPMGRAVESAVLGDEPDPADHLPCRFAESGQAPTSDGWGSLQMDGPGLWLWALERHARADGSRGALDGNLLRAAAVAAEYISATWRRPSYDAWEEHGDQLSTSTLAACLAGLLAAHRLGLEAWDTPAAVEGIRRELGERAHRLGYLPRSDTDDAVDASILWCGPLLRAFHPTEPAWTATLQRVEAELVGPGGGVYRYRSDTF